jgi:hypothetical protein
LIINIDCGSSITLKAPAGKELRIERPLLTKGSYWQMPKNLLGVRHGPEAEKALGQPLLFLLDS